VLFVSLTESAAEVMHGHFDTLYHIFLQGLQDSESKVRLQALRSVQVNKIPTVLANTIGIHNW
jgi:hypothetical protein